VTETIDSAPERAAAVAFGIRRRALKAAIDNDGAYLGQACSSAELLAVLHALVMDHEAGEELIISPAHYTLAHWAAMAETGRLDEADLAGYARDGAKLEMIGGGGSPGMPFTTGSLSQGLSQAIGSVLGRRLLQLPALRMFVLMSDGELQEGQSWEALLTAAHHGLWELTVLVDVNESQVDGPTSEVTHLEPIPAKLRAFGWDTCEVDGHDVGALTEALTPAADETGQKPRAIVCRTVIWQGFPSLKDRHNLHFVRFREGEAELAAADLARAAGGIA
jgi:transketolase